MFPLSRSEDQDPYKMVSKGLTCRKVQLVYYLSRGGLLEQPHLLEVSISSTEGLYLRDVKKRLTVIRGKSMPSSFAWSYKRSYKNGYVWQDVCDDDLIFPANGCDYVLKGSSITDSFTNKSLIASSESSPNAREAPADRPIKYRLGTSKVVALERSAESGDGEDCCSMTSPESQEVHGRFDFDQIHDDLISTATRQGLEHRDPEVSAPTAVSETIQTEGNKSPIMVHECKMYAKVASPVLVEIGSDAATQTEDLEMPFVIPRSQHLYECNSRGTVDSIERPTELVKGEISPPPCSSSSTSNSASGKIGSSSRERDEQEVEQAGQENERSKGEIEVTTPRPTPRTLTSSASSAGKSARDSVIAGVRSQQGDEPLAGSKSRYYGSGFRQLVSCGGVDVKERDSSQATVENLCDLLRLGRSRKWSRTSSKRRTAPMPPKNSASCEPELVGMPPGLQNLACAESSDDLREKDGDVSRSLPPDQLGIALSDTTLLKIDRRPSGNSDRSSIPDRDVLVCQNKRSGSGDQRKSMPVFGSDKSFTKPEDESAASSIVFKVDQPMDFKEQLQLLAISSGQFEPPSQSKIKFRNKAFNFGNQKASHEAMQALSEEMGVPRAFENSDERPLPPERSKADWEKVLQCAVDEGVTPPDFNLCLQQCLHCGRKFRPESLKVHRRSCNNKHRGKSKDGASTSQLKRTSETPLRVED